MIGCWPLKNLDAICAIEGVDGIFIGPSELSAALGNLGNPVDAEVQAAMQEIFACARPHGRAVSIFALEGVRCSPLPGTGRKREELRRRLNTRTEDQGDWRRMK